MLFISNQHGFYSTLEAASAELEVQQLKVTSETHSAQTSSLHENTDKL